MERLPPELVGQICSYLCIHCTAPDAFPHADTAEARLAKASLARFSRVSRYIRAVAQPYVFHYFATGNMVSLNVSDKLGCAGIVALNPDHHENDRLPLFLRSILQRPLLADKVKALQLIASPVIDDLNAVDQDIIWRRIQARQDWLTRKKGAVEDSRGTSEAFRILSRVSVHHRIKLDNVFHPRFNTNFGGGWKHTELDTRVVQNSLQQLAALFCPNATSLVRGTPWQYIQPWGLIDENGYHLPSLRTIGILSHTGQTHYVDQLRLPFAPNAEAVHCAHLTASASVPTPAPVVRVMRWPIPPPSVRKLAISDLDPEMLCRVLDSCPQLRDLEYRHHGCFDERACVDGSFLFWALMPCRTSLRRLLLVSMADGDPRGYYHQAAIPSLADFERLEELAISQLLIDRFPLLLDSCGTDLAEFLPRPIRDLHLMYVWRDMTADLERLARDAPAKLPNLRSVHISYMHCPENYPSSWSPVPAYQHERVRELFAAASVSMTWDITPFEKTVRQAAPEDCGIFEKAPGNPYSFWGFQ